MSIGAIEVDNSCFMKSSNNSNGNNSYEYTNVDINHILNDIGKYKKGRKRNMDSLYNDLSFQDERFFQKKIKTGFIDLKSEDEEEKDETSYQDDQNGLYSGIMGNSTLKCLENTRRGNNNVNNNVMNNLCTTVKADKKNVSKIILKDVEQCVDTILYNIRNCNELSEAKKIMIPLLTEFVQNNVIYNEENEENKRVNKSELDSLQKERKILRSAVRWQYQMILQSQKEIENQKNELKKKADELNQIKAKVHQYIYDYTNPPKDTLPRLYPDVY